MTDVPSQTDTYFFEEDEMGENVADLRLTEDLRKSGHQLGNETVVYTVQEYRRFWSKADALEEELSELKSKLRELAND